MIFFAGWENRSASLDILVRFAPKISELPDPRSAAPIAHSTQSGFAPPRFDSLPASASQQNPCSAEVLCVACAGWENRTPGVSLEN